MVLILLSLFALVPVPISWSPHAYGSKAALKNQNLSARLMMSVCFLARLLLCLPLHCLPVVCKHLPLSSHFMLIPLVWYLLVLGFSKVHVLELITLYSFGGISYTRINCVYIYTYTYTYIYTYTYTYTYTYMRQREKESLRNLPTL